MNSNERDQKWPKGKDGQESSRDGTDLRKSSSVNWCGDNKYYNVPSSSDSCLSLGLRFWYSLISSGQPNETNVGIQSLLTNSYCLRFICVVLGPERQELGRCLVPLAVPHFYLLSVMVPWPFLSFVVDTSLCGENGWWFSLWYIRLVVIHEL